MERCSHRPLPATSPSSEWGCEEKTAEAQQLLVTLRWNIYLCCRLHYHLCFFPSFSILSYLLQTACQSPVNLKHWEFSNHKLQIKIKMFVRVWLLRIQMCHNVQVKPPFDFHKASKESGSVGKVRKDRNTLKEPEVAETRRRQQRRTEEDRAATCRNLLKPCGNQAANVCRSKTCADCQPETGAADWRRAAGVRPPQQPGGQRYLQGQPGTPHGPKRGPASWTPTVFTHCSL